MTISTQSFFDQSVNQMRQQQGRVNEIQAQVATGKQVIKPSDAPDQAVVIARLKSALSKQEGFDRALTSVENRLTAEDNALVGLQNALIRMKELTTQGANDTYGPQDRMAIALELQGLMDHVVSLANSQDVSGNYVFAGSRVQTKPYTVEDGAMVYQGDDTVSSVFISEQLQLEVNRPGSDLFGPVDRSTEPGDGAKREFFAALGDLVDAMGESDYDGIHQGLADLVDMTDQVSLALAKVGTEMTIAESRREMMNELVTRYKSLLSEAEDLDYSKAVTELSAEMLTLEAAQSSFAKISSKTLFDYIR
jgi:flagellar hook-associated protein 3 FlgL